MKLLFVLENYIPHIGGVETVFKNLCEGLAEEGHDIKVVTHRLKGTKRFEIINGVKVFRVDCFHSRYWFSFLSIPLVLKLAKKADLIHTTTYNGALPTKVASVLRNKKSIITVHEILGKNWQTFEMSYLSAKVHQLLEKIIIRLNFDLYVGVSKSTQQQIINEGVKKSKTTFIYNGVDYKHWNPKRYDGDKIRKELGLQKNWVYLFYGRPGVSKGLEHLIRAVPAISEKIPNAKLVAIISKDKAYQKRYDYVIGLIDRLNIRDKVLILDPVKYNELPNYIKMADCIVVPSLTEGFGYTAAEACAMGKPLVATNTTSLPEVVSGKFVLVKPKCQISLALGVFEVHRNKYNKTKLKMFKNEANIKGYLDVYERLR